MTERKTLIERLAAQRESAETTAPPQRESTIQCTLPQHEKLFDPPQTRLEIVRSAEQIERASVTAFKQKAKARSFIWASVIKWFATAAVVIAGVACFVLLPSAKPDAPVASGVVKPQTELPKADLSAADTRPAEFKSAAGRSVVVQKEATIITVTPVVETPLPLVTEKRAVVPRAKAGPRPVPAAVVTASNKAPNGDVRGAQSVAPAPIARSNLGVEKPITISEPVAPTASCGGSGLAAEQCQACGAKPWLARLNCESQIRASYCSTREGKSADCPVNYNTRG